MISYNPKPHPGGFLTPIGNLFHAGGHLLKAAVDVVNPISYFNGK